MSDTTTIREAIQEHYGAIARSKGRVSCCGPSSCGCSDPISSELYSTDETADLPREAVAVSQGCGNPTALIDLSEGQTVLDLGSGGGIDVLLSAKRVGRTGKVYGLDMTDDMLAVARDNQRRAGATNVEFLKGTIESIPLPDRTVDVIISNCVINLSTDKDAVLREAFRVLKPGGQFAVSDIVLRGTLPPDVRQSIELWAGCMSGALQESDYVAKLAAAGFEDVNVEAWRVYTAADVSGLLEQAGIDPKSLAPDLDGKAASAFIRARRPIERA